MKWVHTRLFLTAATCIAGIIVASVASGLLNGSTEEFLSGLGLVAISACAASFLLTHIWKAKGRIEV